MKHEYSAGAFVFKKVGDSFKLLMLKRIHDDSYDLPKGHIEKGETEEQAARREIFEESGLTVAFVPGFREVSDYKFYRKGGAVAKTVVYYLVETRNPKVKVSDEHEGYLWCGRDEAKKRGKYKNLAPHLDRAFAYIEKAHRMRQINKEYEKLPSKVKGWDLSRRFVPGDGPLDAKMMILGQAPGRNEDIQRKPFVGRSGKLLTKILGEVGVKRDSVYITSVVQFFPPENRAPSPKEIELCKELLMRQIDVIKPKVVVLLGNIASQNVLGLGEVKKNHGRTLHRGRTYYVLTYHPAAVLRFGYLYKEMREDLMSVRKLA